MNDREHESQALQRHSQELSILNDVARALNASVDLPALLASALEKVVELLGLSTGWVLLLDEASGEPYLAAAQNLPPGLLEEPQLLTGWFYSPPPLTTVSESGADTNFSGCSFCSSM